MGVSQNEGYHFGGLSDKDYNILECVLGSPCFGKLPYSGADRRLQAPFHASTLTAVLTAVLALLHEDHVASWLVLSYFPREASYCGTACAKVLNSFYDSPLLFTTA